MENNEELVSVSDYAKRIGKSTQTVYNMIKSGKLQSKTFKRGTMRGIVVCVNNKEFEFKSETYGIEVSTVL